MKRMEIWIIAFGVVFPASYIVYLLWRTVFGQYPEFTTSRIPGHHPQQNFALAIATVQPLYLPFGVMVLKVGAVAAKGWILSLARYGDSQSLNTARGSTNSEHTKDREEKFEELGQRDRKDWQAEFWHEKFEDFISHDILNAKEK